MDTIVETKNLTKIYNNNFYALNNVSINIYNGELLVILGASGSGKSTLLNLIGGIDSPSSGNILFKGTDITKYSEKDITNYRRKNIGFIYQSYNLINELTVYENVLLTKAKNVDIDDILDKVGLKNKKNSYPKNLSGGEQQRVAIARALAKDSDILLCDEPTGSLDSNTSKQILLLLENLCRYDGKTVVIVTHNNDVERIADRIYIMKNASVIKEMINNPISVDEVEW